MKNNSQKQATQQRQLAKALESTSKMFRTTYAVAVNWLNSALVMCNHIWEIDTTVAENIRFSIYSEDGEIFEIYQSFITDCSLTDVEFLEEHFGLKFTYSELLECFILCVDHYGTAWDYVMIDTDLEQASCEPGTDKI